MYRRLQDTGQSVSVVLTFCTDESVPILLEPISRVLQDPKHHNTFGRTEGLIYGGTSSQGGWLKVLQAPRNILDQQLNVVDMSMKRESKVIPLELRILLYMRN